MADEIKLKAPTVEQQVVVNINGEDKIKSFADTLDKISNNKNLQKYWKTQQDLINATADAYSNFQKKASKDNASELIKVTNALKAMSGTDLSHILPDFDKISKSIAEAQKVAGNIDSAFSVKGFKEAFDSFETLKAYGTDIQKLFSHFGVSSDIGELQQNVRLLEGEVEKLTRRLINAKNANEELRNEFENFKAGSGFADKLDELDRLKAEMQNIRDEATQTFNQFLDANKIDRYDWFSDDRFAEYFEELENGTLTATDAIRRFKSEYSYLLEDSYKSSGDSFGLDQLQAFSTKLDSIFHQVEETSNKINDIISNGVIAKSVQNLSEDTAISDSQRSIFGNILQDEESLKSITALFQKLIDETNQTKNTEVFNTEQFTKIELLFTSIESSLSSIKGVLVDVGDGEELSPLLKTITNVESGIDKLSSSVKGIGLNMNIDFGSDTEMEAKIQAKISNALQAYQRLFDHIKSLSAGGSLITQKFFDFDINQFDTPMSKLQAYKKFIENMRNETKSQFNGKDILYSETDKKYWSQASSAMGQVTKAFNEMKASTNTNPLENIFGKTDLTEVIEQLNIIVSKLDEISVSAKGFTKTLKNGLNINASVEEIEKLTNRVKELESELAKIKTPTTIPSEDIKDAFPDKDISTSVESATNSIKEENNVLEQNTQKVKENTQAKEQNANANLNKYDKRLDSYNGKVDKYQATIDRFNDGGWTSKTYLENVQAVRDAVKQYATLLNNIKTNQNGIATDEDIQNLDKYEKKIKDTIATVTNMSAAEKGYKFEAGQKELDKIHKLLNENSRMSSDAKAKIKDYYKEIESGNPSMSLDKIHGEILKIYNAEIEAGRAGRTLWDTLKNSGFHQLAAQMAGMFGFYDVINLGKEAISTIVSLDDALVDLKKTTAMNKTQLEDFYYDANDVAKQMGVTTEEIITQASAWSRLGYSSQEAATTMAKLSSKFASISPGMSTDEAQEGLVSIMKAFDIDPDDVETEIMDKVNVLGNKFAEENQDVIEGLKRSAAAMSAMGQSFTDTAALFTGGMEILQDSESMGTALRTLSMRVRGYDEETNQLSDDLVNVTGEVADLTKTAQDSQGVSLFTDATQEHYKSMVEYLGDIADRWDQISEKNQTELLQKLFGKNRANESVCPYVQKCA
nr:MAG TPA: minor tail protein [Bacteriophage sp.]